MRFFKLSKKYNFNWQYVLGEIFLIFVGINLAIWFNNWNTSKQTNSDKQAVIVKIAGEIGDNLEDIQAVYQTNQSILTAYGEFSKYYHEGTNEVIASVSTMQRLTKEYPRYFRITDSTLIENDTYQYHGNTYVQLDLSNLSDVAWETTRAFAVAREFSYDCLYGIESLYNLQRRTQIEMDKAGTALQQRELEQLINSLNFANQLIEQLIENYEEALKSVDECR